MRATITRMGTVDDTLTPDTREELLAAFRDWRAHKPGSHQGRRR